jgi:hypothetical protein
MAERHTITFKVVCDRIMHLMHGPRCTIIEKSLDTDGAVTAYRPRSSQ